MPTKAVVDTQTLEERVAEKMADVIGDLITPADMEAMVEKGIRKALFKERVEQSTGYLSSTVTKPCLVDEMVEKHLTAQMKATVEMWLKEHPDERVRVRRCSA